MLQFLMDLSEYLRVVDLDWDLDAAFILVSQMNHKAILELLNHADVLAVHIPLHRLLRRIEEDQMFLTQNQESHSVPILKFDGLYIVILFEGAIESLQDPNDDVGIHVVETLDLLVIAVEGAREPPSIFEELCFKDLYCVLDSLSGLGDEVEASAYGLEHDSCSS